MSIFKFTNNFIPYKLAAGIAAGDTTLNIESGKGGNFPNPASGEEFRAVLFDSSGNVEILKVTTRSGDVFSVIVRGQEGTTARAWTTNDWIQFRLTAAMMENYPQVDKQNTWNVKQTMAAAFNESEGVDIASAATTDIGAATGNYVNVTGSVSITSFGTIQAGVVRHVRFTGAPTLVYNATSLILPSGANTAMVANQVMTFMSLGSGNWQGIANSLSDAQALLGLNSAWTGSNSHSGAETFVTKAPGTNTTDAATTAFVTAADIVVTASVTAAFQAADSAEAAARASGDVGAVHLTGSEAISGNKTFSGTTTFTGPLTMKQALPGSIIVAASDADVSSSSVSPGILVKEIQVPYGGTFTVAWQMESTTIYGGTGQTYVNGSAVGAAQVHNSGTSPINYSVNIACNPGDFIRLYLMTSGAYAMLARNFRIQEAAPLSKFVVSI